MPSYLHILIIVWAIVLMSCFVYRRNARENGGGAVQILACMITSCMDCIYAVISHVTKYATIQCAITGAAFCDAARSVSR